MSHERPTLSLITATYNRIKLLPRLVESLRSQTLTNFEWIVVDDGSTDGTDEYIASLRDPRIKLIKQSNQGCNAARNRAELEIKAEFVIHIDSDDELVGPDTLWKMVERIKKTPASIGAIAFSVLTPDRSDNLSSIKSDELAASLNDLLCGCKVKGEFFRIYKLEAIKVSPWPSDYAGMEVLKYLAITKHFKILHVRDPALIYHMNHGENITSARGTIARAKSMAEGYEELIHEYQDDFRKGCPKALGLNLFHCAMYFALDGRESKAFRHSINSIGNRGPIIQNILLIASLITPIPMRRCIFIWRSRLKGKL